MRHSTKSLYGMGIKKMPILYRKAMDVWCAQKSRCNNPNNKKYKNYGAKGIKVKYNSKDFIEWYVENHPSFSNIHVGRIDHSKDYSLDNIIFQTAEENGKEVTNRLGPVKPRKRINIYCADTGLFLGSGQCSYTIQLMTGINKANASLYCNGKYKKSKHGYTLRYAEEL